MKKIISMLLLILCLTYSVSISAASDNSKSITSDEISQNEEFCIGIYTSGKNKVYSYSCEVLYNENDTEFEGIDAGLFVYDLKNVSGDICFYYRKGRLVGYTKVTKEKNRAIILITSVGKSDFLEKIIAIKFKSKSGLQHDVLLQNENAVLVSDEGIVFLGMPELTYTCSKCGICLKKCIALPSGTENTVIDIKAK